MHIKSAPCELPNACTVAPQHRAAPKVGRGRFLPNELLQWGAPVACPTPPACHRCKALNWQPGPTKQAACAATRHQRHAPLDASEGHWPKTTACRALARVLCVAPPKVQLHREASAAGFPESTEARMLQRGASRQTRRAPHRSQKQTAHLRSSAPVGDTRLRDHRTELGKLALASLLCLP